MRTRYTGPLTPVVRRCAELTFAPLPCLSDEPPTPGLPEPSTGAEVRWRRMDDFVADGQVPVTFDAFREQRGPRQIAAATVHYLKGIGRELVFLASAGTYLSGRAPELDPATVWLPVDGDGLPGAVLLAGPKVGVLDDQDDGEHPLALQVADEAELDALTSEGLLRLFGPLIDALAKHTRVGRRSLWGWVIDTLHFYMLNPARRRGDDLEKAWMRAERLSATLLAAGAPIRRQPRLFWFQPEAPRGAWAVRGTCCFDYRADPQHGYCITCPLEADSVRQNRFVETFGDR